MARQRFLANAPITEALIDFRAEASRTLTDAWHSRLRAILAERYPKSERINRIEIHFEASGGPDQSVVSNRTPTQMGWMFRTADGLQVAQFRTDGFTFNRLRPYTRWEDLFPQALELWKLYVDVAGPQQVGRLAARFINRLPRVAPSSTFGLTVPPKTPPDVPLTLRSFLSRQVVYDAENASSANITQTVEETVPGPTPALLLDIDAFWEGNLDPTDSRIEPLFQTLRVMKNRIFFASITEDTAGLYE